MQREEHLVVSRHARVVRLGVASPTVRQVWLACHGYGQLAARFISRFAPIVTADRLIVAPEALNRFYLDGRTGPHGPHSRVGATWMTREDRLAEIDDYVHYLDRVYASTFEEIDRARVRVIAFGFSQGVATICRWASRTDARIDEIVLWAGALPPELEPGPRLFAVERTTLAAGTADAHAGGAKLAAHAAALRGRGMAVDELAFDGGHEITGDALALLARRFDARA
jgi:predicted esterase